MTKSEFIKHVAAKSGLSQRDAARAVDAFLDLVTDALKAGESVSFTGFGKFSTQRRGQRGDQPYQHLTLSASKLQNGLSSFGEDDVPSEPLALLALEPEDLEARGGFRFAETFDDRDSLRVAVLQLPSQRKVALIRYTHAPEPGTLVAVGPADVANSTMLAELLDALEVTDRELVWSRVRRVTSRVDSRIGAAVVPKFSAGSGLRGAVGGRRAAG